MTAFNGDTSWKPLTLNLMVTGVSFEPRAMPPVSKRQAVPSPVRVTGVSGSTVSEMSSNATGELSVMPPWSLASSVTVMPSSESEAVFGTARKRKGKTLQALSVTSTTSPSWK